MLATFLLNNPLIELWLITLFLAFMWWLMKKLKQPVLIGYILWWLLLGPQLFNVIQHYDNIDFYAHFGVSLLLFMVWLGLNPKIVKEVGKVATIAWVWQVLFTFLTGYLISLALWFSPIWSLFIAIALTFSSTIVIVKLITDRWDSNTTYGKVALWVLIVQDIIAMLILLTISASALDVWADWFQIGYIIRIVLNVLWLLGVAWFSAVFILPKVTKVLAKENELLLLFVIAWAILFGWLRYYAWFTMEIWALLAWVTLASSRYRFHIFSELRPFRDFFLALFFVYLWGQIMFDNIGRYILPILIFSTLVLIGNPAIIVTLMMKLWYNRKEWFMAWLTVAQISEFSFIIVALALTSGALADESILSLITIVWLITMTGSSYMFAHAESLFVKVEPWIKTIENKLHPATPPPTPPHHSTQAMIIIVWFGRLWQFICSQLKKHQISFCVVDNNTDKINKAEKKWYTAIYGDCNDAMVIDWLISAETKAVYCTVESHDTNLNIVTFLNDKHPSIKAIGLALYIDEAEDLYNHHADYVIVPHLVWAQDARQVIETHLRQPEQLLIEKIKHRESIHYHKQSVYHHE